MSFSGWTSPAEREDEQRAAAAAQARAKMSPFERMLLDQLGVIGESMAAIRGYVTTPLPLFEVDEDGSTRLVSIELDDVDRMSAAAALVDAFPTLNEDFTPEFWIRVLDVAVLAINGTRSAAATASGAASAEPEDGDSPGSARQLWKRADCETCRDDVRRGKLSDGACPGHATKDGPL